MCLLLLPVVTKYFIIVQMMFSCTGENVFQTSTEAKEKEREKDKIYQTSTHLCTLYHADDAIRYVFVKQYFFSSRRNFVISDNISSHSRTSWVLLFFFSFVYRASMSFCAVSCRKCCLGFLDFGRQSYRAIDKCVFAMNEATVRSSYHWNWMKRWKFSWFCMCDSLSNTLHALYFKRT